MLRAVENLIFFFQVSMWYEPKRSPSVSVFFIWLLFFTVCVEPKFWTLKGHEISWAGYAGAILFIWTCLGIHKITSALRDQRRYLFLLLDEVRSIDPNVYSAIRKKNYHFLCQEDDYKETVRYR